MDRTGQNVNNCVHVSRDFIADSEGFSTWICSECKDVKLQEEDSQP